MSREILGGRCRREERRNAPRVFALISSGDVQAALDAAEAITSMIEAGEPLAVCPTRSQCVARGWPGLARQPAAERGGRFRAWSPRSSSTWATQSSFPRNKLLGMGSGARVTNRLVYVYGFRGGKVVYFDAFDTKEKALEAVGLRE